MEQHPKPALLVSGPYSQALRVGDFVFLSGVLPITGEGEIVQGGIEEEIRHAFRNLVEVAKLSGGSSQQVVKVTVYLTDMNAYDTLNQVTERVFTAPFPARTVVQAGGLPRSANVCVDAVMHLGKI